MNLLNFRNLCALALISLGLPSFSVFAAEEPAKGTSAGELASRLSDLRQDGNSSVRLRMEIRGGSKTNLQLLIKQRRSKGSSEVVYQVLWPKERKGEAVLLRKSANGPTSGIHLTANGAQPIDPSDALFDGDLAYEDAVDNFFAWDQQAVVGTEAVDGVECQIL